MKAVLVILIAAFALAGTYYYLHIDSAWSADTVEETGLFRSEFDAAYSGSETIKTEPPFSTLRKGEWVTVAFDVYGKDYWACFVRTQTSSEGWLLCGSLRKNSAAEAAID